MDQLHGAEVLSGIDLKAGFHNIPMNTASIPLTAFVTQDGVYEQLRMTFGMCEAQAHFQKAVTLTIATTGDEKVTVYLDDILLFGTDVADVWSRTLAVIGALVKAGFMVNIRKCHFLCKKVSIVGNKLEWGFYSPVEKPLSKLFGT
jgi:Reverse transcriptase (RNA-dependent DNA polymerase)